MEHRLQKPGAARCLEVQGHPERVMTDQRLDKE